MADEGGSSRAAERTGATAAPGDIAVVPCPNCGHERNSRFCAKCGQNDRDYIRALPPVLGDILKETFELDSRIFRTIKPLFLRPGELPSEFSRNRRASYVSPIRLYIFSSLAFFFLLSVTTDFEPPGRQEAADGDRQPIRIEAEIQRERAGATIEVLKSLLPPEQQRKVDEIIRRPGMYLSKSVLYGLATNLSADDFESDWNRYLLARVIDIAEDPKAGLSLVLDNLPFAMFVTLPIYTLLLMLFFRRRGRFFTEHLVFAVQLHTFAFIVLTVLVLVPDRDARPREALARAAIAAKAATVDPAESDPRPVAIANEGERSPANGVAPPGASADALPMDRGTLQRIRQSATAPNDAEEDDGGSLLEWIRTLLVIWVMVYHYLALRRYYGNGRVKTFFKWSALTISYLVLLIPGLALSTVLAIVQL